MGLVSQRRREANFKLKLQSAIFLGQFFRSSPSSLFSSRLHLAWTLALAKTVFAPLASLLFYSVFHRANNPLVLCLFHSEHNSGKKNELFKFIFLLKSALAPHIVLTFIVIN